MRSIADTTQTVSVGEPGLTLAADELSHKRVDHG